MGQGEIAEHFAGTGNLPALMSETDFAKAVGKHPNTTRQWRKLGTGPAYIRLGHAFYYRREAVATWLCSLEVAPAPALAPA